MKKNKISKILFVINPKSGRGFKVNSDAVISKFSVDYGFQYEIFKTTGKDDGTKIREQVDEYKPDTVVAVGGDGTINIVAEVLIGTQMKLGIIPNGSANGLAYNLNMPAQFEEALRRNLDCRFKPIDVIRVNDKHYCLHLSDLGINARIVKRFEREGGKGLIGYGKQLVKELFSKKSFFTIRLETADATKRTKAEMVVIANAKSYGTGISINPYGHLDDGKFEVIIIKPYPWWFLFTFIYRSLTGKLEKLQYVDVFKTDYAELKVERYQDFQVDGEIKEKAKTLKLEIVPHALNICYVE